MVFFFRLLTRLLVIAFGYFTSVFAGVLFVVFAVLNWRSEMIVDLTPEEEFFTITFMIPFGLHAFVVALNLAFLPAIAAATLIEFTRFRSVYYHLCFGGAIGVVVLMMGNVYEAEPPTSDLVIALAAGFIGGAVYWLIAGRGAGALLPHAESPST